MTDDRKDRLRPYRDKRRFDETPEPDGPEPEGAVPPADGRLSFVVQKHDATRLHWDFRLEWRGVLLSWAVTRGPSADPSEKRLAVRTEDHPLDYAAFEGTIPKGNYGAGTVMLWDRGFWSPLHDPDEGLRQGKLHFTLDGARMTGGWGLVRMRPRKGTRGREETRENWLLVKERDADATEDPDSLVRSHMTSIATGRSMDRIARGDGPGGRQTKATQPAPPFADPQLATLQGTLPQGRLWWHEVKMDGYRGQISLGGDGLRIFSRSGADWTDRFAPLAPAAAALPCKSALIDGEVMAEGGDFTALRTALSEGGALLFYAFDLLHLNGRDLREKPLKDRRRALEKLFQHVPPDGPLRLSPVVADGGEAFDQVCAIGGEGIVSKRSDAPYRAGRGLNWIKVKCDRRAEFLILGYLPSDKPGRDFASLFMGSREDGRITYRGKVGTGFDEATFRSLRPLFAARKEAAAPADAPRSETRGAVWLRPDLVAQVRFAEYTADGRIRHGVFQGLREDKPAMDVSAEDAPDRNDPERNDIVAGVRITSPRRPVFPDDGVSKLALARYLEAVAERMLQTLADRPLAFVRHPDGIAGKGFFQKHKTEGWPDAIRTFPDGDGDHQIYLDSVDGIVAAAQMGVVEFHIQGVRRDRIDRPDRLVFDLDPDDAIGQADLVSAAHAVRDRLAELGLPSAPVVTGGKGIHVVVTLNRRTAQDSVAQFARTLAALMASQEPDRFVATMSKAKREGRIFIDWLRNQRGATAICPFSPRARTGARVAIPVTWDELGKLDSPRDFGLDAARDRAALPAPAAAGLTAAVLRKLDRMARA